MNRQIKFRGFSSKDDRFHYGFAFNPHLDVWYILHSDDDLPFKETERECLVAKSSIGQFTGLKDVDDKEIFEGDIVLGYNNPHIVTYADGAFYLTYKNSSVRLSRTCGALQIIGNIFQNPDLLQSS